MVTIRITVIRERKSFEKAEVAVEIEPGDFVDDVVGRAELIATDLGLWKCRDSDSWPYVSEDDRQKIADAANPVEEQP
jgi:hypothetical protein